MPRFADRTFKRWFSQRPVINPEGPRVLLWPDTFNNHFHPQVARAAVGVLEEAGMNVIVPRAFLCCGRPLYDYGMLDTARKLLHRVLEALGEEIDRGTPLVALEPSCLAVFRDELTGLLPFDRRARRLRRQAFTLAEFLMKKVDGYRPPDLSRRALVHLHCHHKAVLTVDCEKALYEAMGLECRYPDSGCCGMAGSFGFEKDKYDISVRCGERVFLPAIRELSAGDLLITDGFSCREQARQLTGRLAVHTSEVLAKALDCGARSSAPGRQKPFVLADEMKPPAVLERDTPRGGELEDGQRPAHSKSEGRDTR